jgi:hypothetical protein
MEPSSPPDGSSRSSRFDADLAWRFAVAFLGALIAVPLILTIVGAIIGIPLLIISCKPLKDYFAKRAAEAAVKQQAIQVQVRIQRRRK